MTQIKVHSGTTVGESHDQHAMTEEERDELPAGAPTNDKGPTVDQSDGKKSEHDSGDSPGDPNSKASVSMPSLQHHTVIAPTNPNLKADVQPPRPARPAGPKDVPVPDEIRLNPVGKPGAGTSVKPLGAPSKEEPAAADKANKTEKKTKAAAKADQPAEEEGPAPEKPKVKPKKQKAFGGISRDTSEYVIESLSMLLLSGVTVGEAIQSIAAEIPKKNVRDALLAMQVDIDEGTPFSVALAKTGLFAPSVITLIEVGESTGKLPENLKVVAAQMHKNNAMNAKIRSAMLYPAFLIGLLFVVGTGIGVFLLPKLLNIINSLDVKVGPITKALIFFGTWFGKYGLIFAAGVVITVIVMGVTIKKSSLVRSWVQTILFRIPGVKKLLFETEIARFGFVLGTLLDAGLPVVTALQSLAASMSTARYAKFASEMRDRVDEGDSFGKILSDKKYRKVLPGTIAQIIVSAEKSGNLSGSLLKVGVNYEDKADITARNLETLMEPIVLVLIAIAVLFVAMAVFLPIYSLIGNLQGA